MWPSRNHLKKRAWAQDQGGIKFPRVAGLPIGSNPGCGSQPADILVYFEELKRGPNADVGFKNFFEMVSKVFIGTWTQNFTD
jgi:hypothetical protein